MLGLAEFVRLWVHSQAVPPGGTLGSIVLGVGVKAVRRGRAIAPAVVVLLALAVGGCTSDAEPSPMPTPSPSPVEPETPSPTPPTMPAEAEGTSPAAAKAFVRHYFDQINYAALSGDTETLRELSTDECQSCDAIAANVERIYNAGGHISEEHWQIRSIDVLKASNGDATLSVGARLGREVIVEATGEETVKAGGKQPMTIFLATDNAGYRVDRLDLVT